jgi:hypothetical protein
MTPQQKGIPVFASKEEAYHWMQKQINNTPTNDRFTYTDDPIGLQLYNINKQLKSENEITFDSYVIVNGRYAKIGCDYH